MRRRKIWRGRKGREQRTMVCVQRSWFSGALHHSGQQGCAFHEVLLGREIIKAFRASWQHQADNRGFI